MTTPEDTYELRMKDMRDDIIQCLHINMLSRENWQNFTFNKIFMLIAETTQQWWEDEIDKAYMRGYEAAKGDKMTGQGGES